MFYTVGKTFPDLGKGTRQAKAVSMDEQKVFEHLLASTRLDQLDTSVHLVP